MGENMIIGLVGRMGSGKTWIADEICRQQSNFVKLSFATALKKMVVECGLCTPEEVYGEKNLYSRKVLQAIGTDIVRKIYPDYWVEQMICKIHEYVNNYADIVIDDVRFLNEAKMIQGWRNSFLVQIIPTKKGIISSHRSETELEQIVCNHQIKNDFSKNVSNSVRKLLASFNRNLNG